MKTNQVKKLKELIKRNKSFTLLYNIHIDYIDRETGGNWCNRTVTHYSPSSFIRIYCRIIDNKPFWFVDQRFLGCELGKKCFPYQLSKDLLKKKILGEPEYKGTFNEDVIEDYCKRVVDYYNPHMFFFDYDDIVKECDRMENESKYRYESKVVREKIADAEEHIEHCKKSMIETTKRMAEYMDIKKEYEQKKETLIKAGNYYKI